MSQRFSPKGLIGMGKTVHRFLVCWPVLIATSILAGCVTPKSPVQVAQTGEAGGIYKCDVEPQLRSVSGAQQVPIDFINQSGGDITLYWLNYQGERVSYGTVRPNLSKPIWTYLTHPWVLVNTAGRCVEIVLPGSLTKTTIIQPGEASSRPIPPTQNSPYTPAPVMIPTPITNLSGTWQLEGNIKRDGQTITDVRPLCALVQNGNKISGHCKGPTNDGDVSGEIDDRLVYLEWHIDNNQVAAVTFYGTVIMASVFRGVMNFASYPQAPFTAMRQ